ncbi:MAG: CvpA family protein [Gammaproteobacteria bacterium]|mgnify:FL=1|jgi:membrane protein required for colicin V production|nr:CvpA family protein [Gammaproteobacteria bacterium]MBT5217480.1 CvpA family protein [Gammaproteobacteria bacterium]MDG2434677.1 CvpA family protein [Gammaproteobacteria bacterium]
MIYHFVIPNFYIPLNFFGSDQSIAMLDFIFIAILVISLIIGIYRGFIKEILSLLTWIVAFWATFSFDSYLEVYFISTVTSEISRIWFSRLIILVIVLLLGAYINKLCSKISSKFAGNIFFGLLFGLLRGFILIAILILFLEDSGQYNEAWVQNAILLEYAENISDFFSNIFIEHYG